tara:strand:+ start:48444 stop:48737 length:294 start_codon:yes stop_codon:yes gene_type:complete
MLQKQINAVTNSAVLSQSLSDCLDTLLDMGLLFQATKQIGKRYEGLLRKDMEKIFSKLSDERMGRVLKEIDQNAEILTLMNGMTFEEKEGVLSKLKG